MIDIFLTNTIKTNISKKIIQPRRAPIYVGFQCHQGCKFCYYVNRCSEKFFCLDDIFNQIDFEYEYGIREFEITGGEPGEFSQLRDVCKYIKSKDNKCKIAIITNGSLYNSNIWDLIDEVLVSYHTPKDDKFIDKYFFPNGSTYNKVLNTVQKAKNNNIFLRTNTIIATFNIKSFNTIIDDIINFNPNIVNFLPVNLFDEAKIYTENYIDYDIIRPLIKEQIDKLIVNIPCQINVRYMPFCKMEGYEKYIVGQLQHIYDFHDWNRELGGINVIQLAKNKKDSLAKLGKYGSKSIESALESRKIFYDKSKECFKCKYYLICDGVEKTSNKSLLKYIYPSKGKIIKNIMQFREQL